MFVRDALIVAGGAGTRLWPLTRTTPKPLVEFFGRPFLDTMIDRLVHHGIERVFLVVGADTAPFLDLARQHQIAGVDIRLVAEPQPLDTAGGVREVLDVLDGPFFVLNGDVLTDLDLTALASHHLKMQADVTISLTHVDDTSSFGVCVLDGHEIVAFVEKPAPGSLPDHTTVNAGTYVIEPAAMRQFQPGPLSFERTVFPGLLAAGHTIAGFVSDAVWMDLGTPERLLEGHRRVLDGELFWNQQLDDSGITLGDDVKLAPSARLQAPVRIGNGAIVEEGATVGPYVVMGDCARIGSEVTVSDSALFSGSALHADARHALLGQGAHVEAGAQLGDWVVVGDAGKVTSGEQVADGSRIPPVPK